MLYVELKNVQATEDKIKQLNYPTPNELWEKMKGKFRTKNELGGVLDYFLKENMILFDKGRIVWIRNPKLNGLLQQRGFFVL